MLYASAYNVGVWRSNDNGSTWTQIHSVTNTGAMRSEFAVATTPDDHTRMYTTEGDSGTPYSRLFRGRGGRVRAPTFVDKTSSNPANPGYATLTSARASAGMTSGS